MSIVSSVSTPATRVVGQGRVDTGANAPILFALSVVVIVLQLSSSLGPLVPAGVVACSAGMLVILRMRAITGRALWFAAFPAMALLSTLWSPSPSLTVYYAIQLCLTIFSGYLILAALELRSFVLVLFVAAIIVCVVSMIVGTTGPSVKGPVLIGLTGSKNAMASCANLAVFAGLAVALDRAQPGKWRLAALIAIPLGIYIIATTRAATTIILSGVMPFILLILFLIHWLPARARLPMLGLVVLLCVATLLAVPDILTQSQDYLLQSFGKDPTLTGRTYLWDVAHGWIGDRPWFGWGYKYQWMSYSPGAIGMLRSQLVVDPRTFSVHQTYLEAEVDTGLVGLILLTATIAVGTTLALWRAAFHGGIVNAFVATFLIGLVVRSFGETFFGPFYAYATIMIVLFGYSILPSGDADEGPRWRRRYVGATPVPS